MKTMKRAFALAGAAMTMYAGAMCVNDCAALETSLFPALPAAQAAEIEAWRPDIDAATQDDTMAFNVYIGKPIKACVEDFLSNGWTHAPNEPADFYIKKEKDYIYGVFIRPHVANKDLVGNYSIRFYAKTREMADEMYMRAEKNFSYNFGRPNVKQGTMNSTWFLNDTFSITVEYNEYDPRMPLVQNYYPYEVAITREMGDYEKFMVPAK